LSTRIFPNFELAVATFARVPVEVDDADAMLSP
jgi:hypothetical protein